MKTRQREKIQPIYANPGDSIQLVYDLPGVFENKIVAEEQIGRKMTVNEVVVFDVEPGDFDGDVKDGIGGAFLSTGE